MALPDRQGAGVRGGQRAVHHPLPGLFAILGPITGYVASYPTAEFALVGYTLLILIWNTVAGLDAVPAEAREAAVAMGYTRHRRCCVWICRWPFPTSSPACASPGPP